MTDAAARRYPSRPFLAASVAVFRQGTVLLAERLNPPGAACFSLPGGIVEPGEGLAEAALRELWEETAVEASILGFNDHVEVVERDEQGRVERHFVVANFVAAWTGGEGTTGAEARVILWADPTRIDHLRTTPGLKRVLERAARFFPAS